MEDLSWVELHQCSQMSPQGVSPARALGTLSVPEQSVLAPVFPLGCGFGTLAWMLLVPLLGEHSGPLIPPDHHQGLQCLDITENKAWSILCLEMSALTSSCLSFPISGVAGVSHCPLESSLVSVPWQARVLDTAQDCGHRAWQDPPSTRHVQNPGNVWNAGFVRESLMPASVLHLLTMKQAASPALCLFVLGFLVPVPNRALAMGRGPRAQPGRGEGPALVTVACAPLSFVPVGVAPLNAMSVLSFLFTFLSVC